MHGPAFDELTRALARGLPRRRILGVFGGGLAAALIGVPKLRGHALAQTACAERLFPADNVWNVPVTDLPVDPDSDAYVASIGIDEGLHPDFGTEYEGAPIGIPFVAVSESQEPVEVAVEVAEESDPGPYPIPPDAPIEGGPDADGDRHVLVLETDNCRLYELFDAHPLRSGGWRAGSGAIFPLTSNDLRPAGWTSADAAGLPILAGLVRYGEVASGRIDHAIRITVPRTQRRYVWPARHFASSDRNPALPPMGLRLRLKASVDISRYRGGNRVILRALKKYGAIVADNGSPWFITGTPHRRWNNDALHELGRIRGSDFEAVDASSLIVDPDSALARRR